MQEGGGNCVTECQQFASAQRLHIWHLTSQYWMKKFQDLLQIDGYNLHREDRTRDKESAKNALLKVYCVCDKCLNFSN